MACKNGMDRRFGNAAALRAPALTKITLPSEPFASFSCKSETNAKTPTPAAISQIHALLGAFLKAMQVGGGRQIACRAKSLAEFQLDVG